MSIAINGDPVTRTRYEGRAPNGPAVTSWTPPVDYSPELLAEVMEMATAENVLHQMIPQEFPCSDYGKKVMRGVKYVWVASVAAFGLACCAGTGGTGCAVCVVGSAVAEEAGSDAIDGYCD